MHVTWAKAPPCFTTTWLGTCRGLGKDGEYLVCFPASG